MNYKKILLRISRKCDESIGYCQQSLPVLRKRVMELDFAKKVFYTFVALEAFTLICAISIPEGGKILPLGRSVVEAYHLLSKSPSGRELIKRVEKNTRGSFVYLTMGETERDELTDYNGEVVLALTRADFRYYDNMRIPRSITVITNKDLIGTDPREVVKSLAFELENVDYAYKNAEGRFGKDSPMARITQAKVILELGLH